MSRIFPLKEINELEIEIAKSKIGNRFCDFAINESEIDESGLVSPVTLQHRPCVKVI